MRRPVKKLWNLYKEVYTDDDNTEDICTRTYRRHIKDYDKRRQEKRDTARQEREERARRSRCARMRTASKDDALTARGANPRTGLISPYITSDNDNRYSDGYAGVELQVKGHRDGSNYSGQWKQIGGEWMLVKSLRKCESGVFEERMLTASVDNENSFTTSHISDRDPHQSSTKQTERHEAGVSKALIRQCRLLDAAMLPTSGCRQGPKKNMIQKQFPEIRRKQVGSGLRIREVSTDAFVMGSRIHDSVMHMSPQIVSGDRTQWNTTGNSQKSIVGSRQSLNRTSRFQPFLGRRVESPDTCHNMLPSKERVRRDFNGVDNNSSLENNPRLLNLDEREESVKGSVDGENQVFRTTPRNPSNEYLEQHLPFFQRDPAARTEYVATQCRSQHFLPTTIRAVRGTRHSTSTGLHLATTVSRDCGCGAVNHGLRYDRPSIERQNGLNLVPQLTRNSCRGVINQRAPQAAKKQLLFVDRSKAAAEAVQSTTFPSRLHQNRQVPEGHSQQPFRGCRAKPLIPATDLYTGWVISDPFYEAQPRIPNSSTAQHPKSFSLSNQRCTYTSCPSITRVEDVQKQKQKQEIEIGTRDSIHERLDSIKEGYPLSRVRHSEALHTTDEDRTDVDGAVVVISQGKRAISSETAHSLSSNEAKCLWLDNLLQLQLLKVLKHLAPKLTAMVHRVLVTFHPNSPAMKLLLDTETSLEGYIMPGQDILMAMLYLLILIALCILLAKVIAFAIAFISLLVVPLKIFLIIMRWMSSA